MIGERESRRENGVWAGWDYGFSDIVISAEKTPVQVTMLIHRTAPSLDLSHDLQQLDNTDRKSVV